MIYAIIHMLVQLKRQNREIFRLSMGLMIFIDTARVWQPTLSQTQTPLVSPTNPSYVVSPNDTHQNGQERVSSILTFLDLLYFPLSEI